MPKRNTPGLVTGGVSYYWLVVVMTMAMPVAVITLPVAVLVHRRQSYSEPIA